MPAPANETSRDRARRRTVVQVPYPSGSGVFAPSSGWFLWVASSDEGSGRPRRLGPHGARVRLRPPRSSAPRPIGVFLAPRPRAGTVGAGDAARRWSDGSTTTRSRAATTAATARTTTRVSSALSSRSSARPAHALWRRAVGRATGSQSSTRRGTRRAASTRRAGCSPGPARPRPGRTARPV